MTTWYATEVLAAAEHARRLRQAQDRRLVHAAKSTRRRGGWRIALVAALTSFHRLGHAQQRALRWNGAPHEDAADTPDADYIEA